MQSTQLSSAFRLLLFNPLHVSASVDHLQAQITLKHTKLLYVSYWRIQISLYSRLNKTYLCIKIMLIFLWLFMSENIGPIMLCTCNKIRLPVGVLLLSRDVRMTAWALLYTVTALILWLKSESVARAHHKKTCRLRRLQLPKYYHHINTHRRFIQYLINWHLNFLLISYTPIFVCF